MRRPIGEHRPFPRALIGRTIFTNGKEFTEKGSRQVTKLTALLFGVTAWAAVAAITVVITFNMGDKNQVLMFLPILAAVVVAWGIGEAVTERVFVEHKEEM